MVWIYGFGICLSGCIAKAAAWMVVAKITVREEPLVGFDPEKWDPRLPEWAQLEAAVRAAAEEGGTSLDEEWLAKFGPAPAAANDEVD